MNQFFRDPKIKGLGLVQHASRRILMRYVRQLRRIVASKFLRNVAVITGGTAAAQLITFAFSPLITRLYGPEAFGVLGVFLAALAVVMPLSNLTYGIAIVIPKSDREAKALIKLSILIGLVVTILLGMALGIFHKPIANAIGFTAASSLLFLGPIVVFFSATAQPLQQWLVRRKQFRVISRIALIEATVSGSSKTAIGLIVATAPVLLMLNATVGIVNTLLLWQSARRTLMGERQEPSDSLNESTNAISFKAVAFKYRDFPLFRTPQVWLNTVSHSIPTLMLAAFVGPAAAGFYSMARRVLGLPSTLISKAVGTVFLPHITAASHRSEKLRPLIIKSTLALGLVGLLPFTIVVVFGPGLFLFIFGDKWGVAGEYARWLAIWLYFGFINVPSVQSIPLLDLQGYFLLYEILVVALRMGALTYGAIVFESDLAAVALFSVVGALVNIVLIVGVIISSSTVSSRRDLTLEV
jgi:O-antigen/teichoic acid export membrane protein